MNGRERVKAAMHFKAPDRVPVQLYYCPVGYYEHGDKLNDLYSTLPGDFGPFVRCPVPTPPPDAADGQGKYHEYRTDGWGTTWEYRIFGVTGIPCGYPIRDMEGVKHYAFPENIPLSGEALEYARQSADKHKEDYYCQHYGGSLLELLLQLCPDEEVYCALAADSEEINLLADKITRHNLINVQNAIAAGADGIAFGDDYGMEKTMLVSPARWREFFKPRLKDTFAPAVRAGLDIHFHSCGMIAPILGDLKEIGVTSIWPQVPAYDMDWLAAHCRELGLSVAVHTDRANTMSFGTPDDVKRLVHREYETFQMDKGGAWFYIEADNGFPYENIEALVNTVRELRK
ncbi:MAG: uroporphyrinogen decarboxylase family protein [Eubacteriales bacterium]